MREKTTNESKVARLRINHPRKFAPETRDRRNQLERDPVSPSLFSPRGSNLTYDGHVT